MQRRRFLTWGLVAVPATAASVLALTSRQEPAHAADRADRIEKTAEQWRETLTDEQFYILRKEGTEPAFSSALNNEKRPGRFVCAGCRLPLFSSETKYDSRTGWPSFWEALPDAVGTKTDFKLILPRTEYHCARCGGHQGHVFDDGPKPTGKRYCNNGLALAFEASNA